MTNAAGGSATFDKPSDNIGVKTIPDYAAYAAQHVYSVNIPGCSTPGKVFVGQRKDPFAVNLGAIFDLINVPGAADFSAGRGGVPARPDAEGRRRRRPRRQERHRARARGADQLPARRRRRRSGDRRLDHRQPAPGRAAQQRAEERPRTPPAIAGGAWTQVSRLGHPLVNEVIIGLPDKDKFNDAKPKDDGQFATYVTNPTLPALIEIALAHAEHRAEELPAQPTW